MSKKDKDILQGFMFENASVRGTIASLQSSFQTIIKQHDYPPIISQILGEMLVAVSLIKASIKQQGRITLQFQGTGRIKLLLAQYHSNFNLRALASWEGVLNQEELLEELREGTIGIIIDPEIKSGASYQGVVPWVGTTLTESIENYFKLSEQISTKLWIAVNEKQAAGLLIQMMPLEAKKLGKNPLGDQDWDWIVHLTNTITAEELLNLNHKKLLSRLYADTNVRLFDPIPVQFGCTCSIKRGEGALKLLGQKEVEEELHNKQKIVVTCEFCNHEYVFDRVDVARIFNQGNQPDTSTPIQ